jgi:hypothetical protein
MCQNRRLRDPPYIGQRTPRVASAVDSRLARIRRSPVLGACGLFAALLCWVGLPGLHVLEHAGEAQPATIVYARDGSPRSARLQALIDEVLYGRRVHTDSHPRDSGHRHSHDPRGPGEGRHGAGSLQHFAIAFAATPTFVLPPVAAIVATLPLALPATQPQAPPAWRLPHPRGPPRSAVAT